MHNFPPTSESDLFDFGTFAQDDWVTNYDDTDEVDRECYRKMTTKEEEEHNALLSHAENNVLFLKDTPVVLSMENK